MLSEFIGDSRDYSIGVAWYNLRWNIAYGIAKFLIRRNIRLSRHDYEEDGMNIQSN